MDGFDAQKDALAGEGFWAGDASVGRYGEAQRQVGGMADADAAGDQNLLQAEAVVANL
jgi:hypothetical protein